MRPAEVLGLITARGGSKSIPRKNMALCAGQPLVYYCINAAQRAKTITRLIISTDDDEIAGYARSHGVEVPFMRPQELAGDDSPDVAAFQHALGALRAQSGYVPRAVVHLRPTAPLMRSSELDQGVELLLSHPEADSVRGVFETPDTPFKMYRLAEDDYLVPLLKQECPDVYRQFAEPFNAERQRLPKMWRQVGDVDVVRTATLERGLMNGDRILPLFLDGDRRVDVDGPRDLLNAGAIIERLRAAGRQSWE